MQVSFAIGEGLVEVELFAGGGGDDFDAGSLGGGERAEDGFVPGVVAEVKGGPVNWEQDLGGEIFVGLYGGLGIHVNVEPGVAIGADLDEREIDGAETVVGLGEVRG